ncbi:MAG: hypothetical protein ACFB6R_05140, partial [Alphaproteobacteria bacterium]
GAGEDLPGPLGMGRPGRTNKHHSATGGGGNAGALGARRLLLLTDVAGVLDGDGTLIERLTVRQAADLIRDGVARGGMIPKLMTAMEAVVAGAEGAVILDGRMPHGLLLELFTPEGAGTLITPDRPGVSGDDAPHP